MYGYSAPKNAEKTFEIFLVVKCLGCNTISFVHRISGKGFVDKDRGKNYIEINYPEKELENDAELLTQEEQSKLPKILRKLYEEVEIAFEYDSTILSGIGLRMLIEAICLEQNIQGKYLKQKIEQLHNAGLITKKDLPALDKLREIGNISAHEIRSVQGHKLHYALKVVNHVLKSIYILPTIQKKLRF